MFNISDSAVCDARPFGEQAVGWSLLVQDHHDDFIWREGVVVEYSPIRDCYRILYSDPAVQSMTRLESLQAGLDMHERPDGEEEFPPTFWESESHTNEYRVRRGGYVKTMSRFKWMKAPNGSGHRPPAVTNVNRFPISGDSALEMPLGGLSWKRAVAQLSAEVTSEPVLTIRDHDDEVLYADFSPCGKFLATASRDGSCNVYALFDPLSDSKEEFDFDRTVCYDFLDLSEFSPGLPDVMVDASTWRWASDASIATRLLCKLNCGWTIRATRRSQADEPADAEREKLYPGRVMWAPDSSSILVASTGPLFWVDMRSLIAGRGPPRLITSITQTPSDVYGGFLYYPPEGSSNLPEEDFEGRIPLDDRLCVLSCTRVIPVIDRDTGVSSLTQRFEVHARPPPPPAAAPPSEGGARFAGAAASAAFDINLGHQALIRAISVEPRQQLMVGLSGVKLTMMDQVVLVDLRNTVTVSRPVPKSLRFPIRLSSPPVRIVDFSRFACCLACRFTPSAEGLLLNLRKFVNHALTDKFYEDPSPVPAIAPDLDVNMEALLLPVVPGEPEKPARTDSENITVMKGHHAYTTKSSPFIIMPDGKYPEYHHQTHEAALSGGSDAFYVPDRAESSPCPYRSLVQVSWAHAKLYQAAVKMVTCTPGVFSAVTTTAAAAGPPPLSYVLALVCPHYCPHAQWALDDRSMWIKLFRKTDTNETLDNRY
ncbi:hypothetical protein FOL47_006338, partial [Perkinsus chesapeaki]